MTANIEPIQPTPPPIGNGSTPRAAGDSGAFAVAFAKAQRAGVASVTAHDKDISPSPPEHLAENIAAAGRAWASLAASGRHVVFEQGANGRVTIELQDDSGNRLESVGPTQLFELLDQEGGD